ncbi:uncharacterized protein LOC122856460 [Aphidius gifuensis]|uniref:uncharacterized protein LOC122856460 n=1 Tax=Aphidius gifuensis TaxID=684658 RepID=UPI001CDD44B1|nr:uncharacterized protein LOC122856460 [Aphidius gifuensis]
MSEVVKIPLRLVKTTYHITTQNTTKFLLQSICHMKNACSQIFKNSIASAQKISAGCWKIIKMYPVSLTFIVINSAIIYGAYKIKTNAEFWEELNMVMAALRETLKYSIVPSKMITSSVLFDDSEIEIFTKEDHLSLKNDNTHNLILSEELDANVQEPFPRGEPIPVKINRFNGSLDNGKLTLTTEDGDTTFTFHNTLSLEVKKTSTTLQDEMAAMEKETFEQIKMDKFNICLLDNKITFKTSKDEYKWPVEDVNSNSILDFSDAFPIIGNFSFSFENIVKIQAYESDEVYHLKHHVKLDCDRKVDENLQNKIATKEVSLNDMIPGGTKVVFDCGTIVFKTQDGRKVIVRNKFDLVMVEDGKKTAYLKGSLDFKATEM